MHKTLAFCQRTADTWFLILPSCMSRATFLDIKCSLNNKNSSFLLALNAFHALLQRVLQYEPVLSGPRLLGNTHFCFVYICQNQSSLHTGSNAYSWFCWHRGGNILTQTDVDKLPEQMQCQLISLRKGVEGAVLLVQASWCLGNERIDKATSVCPLKYI